MPQTNNQLDIRNKVVHICTELSRGRLNSERSVSALQRNDSALVWL